MSRFTVLEAYDRLVSKGLIEPRQGAGYFVKAAVPLPPLADAAVAPSALPRSLMWLGCFEACFRKPPLWKFRLRRVCCLKTG